MKKIFTLIILTGIMANMGLAQPTASMTIENPRIDASKLYWDVYFMRTNDDPEWFVLSAATLGDCSWYWDFNITDLTNYQIVEENTTLFPPSNYTNSIAVIGGQLRINTDYTLNVPGTNIELDVWYKAFTLSADISGTVTNESDLFWDMTNTGITTANNESITESYFDSDCDIALNTNCWTGASSASGGSWDNPSNWSSGSVPTASDAIIYPNNPDTEFSGFSGATRDAVVGSLRVNHLAELFLAQNTSLTVSNSVLTGDVLLKGGPRNIILDANAANVPGTLSSAFIPEGTINYNSYALEAGHIEVHRTLYYENTDLDYYHHQVAAPVGGVTLGDWDMIHEYSYAYELLPDQSWFNIYEPTRPTNPGYGFILSLYGNSGFPTATQDLVFYDNLVLGNVNPAINPGDNIVSLIGNPYTAPISWDYMIADGTNNMEDVVYVWDPAAGSYATYLSTEGGAGNQSARYIQPGQAFFVEAKDNVPVFNITPGARTTIIEPYLKSAPQNLLRLYTAGGNTTYDETYIRFVGADVTGGYDSDYDAKEWPSSYGEDATEIYTVGSDGQYMSIDSRPLSPELMSVPLSFKPAVEAEYTLAVDVESMQSFSPGTEIFLEDTYIPSQAWIDLREFPEYTFNAAPQDDYARFIVHFQIKDFGIDELAQKPISIFGERTDAIVKNNSGQRINEIQVYDIAGNLMSVKAGITSEVTRMFVSSNTGYYVIKVITDKAVYSEKVLITK